MPFNPKFTITPKINKALVEIERVRGFLDAIKLKDDWVADMQKKALILEPHHSTHIEGTEISLEQAQIILSGKKVIGVTGMMRKSFLITRKQWILFRNILVKTIPYLKVLSANFTKFLLLMCVAVRHNQEHTVKSRITLSIPKQRKLSTCPLNH